MELGRESECARLVLHGDGHVDILINNAEYVVSAGDEMDLCYFSLLPKMSADSVAKAIVQGLEQGLEDVYPGELARELFFRWRQNPKVLERELAAGSLG